MYQTNYIDKKKLYLNIKKQGPMSLFFENQKRQTETKDYGTTQ